MLTTNIQELKGLNACLRDEHTALQLAFASLEDKLRKVQVSSKVNFAIATDNGKTPNSSLAVFFDGQVRCFATVSYRKIV